jgi:hypothetical protein
LVEGLEQFVTELWRNADAIVMDRISTAVPRSRVAIFNTGQNVASAARPRLCDLVAALVSHESATTAPWRT